MLTIVMAFGAFVAFGQEQQPQEKKSASQLMQEWREQDNKRAVERLGETRKLLDEWVAKYSEQLKARTQLTDKLKRALADGDETLIEVAVSDLNGNRWDLEHSAEWIVKKEGEDLLSEARSTYKAGLITEEAYAAHLKFYRQQKAHTEESLPTELAGLIKQARQKVPDYFAILEQVNGPIKAWQ